MIDKGGIEQEDEVLQLDIPIAIFPGLTSLRTHFQGCAGRDGDTTKRLETLMQRLRSLGPIRPLRLPVVDWPQKLDELEENFANFSAVINTIVRPHLFMLSSGHKHRMAPVVLIGPPGVGKTQFARELQSIFAVPAIFLMIAGETNGSALSGSSIFWGNSSPGQLFEFMAWGSAKFPGGGVANPLVIVDEVDKSIAGHHDPLAALYTLLEQETAERFEDQSIPGLTCNMQYVTFVMTANDERAIPAPLRSRVCEFQIAVPSPAQARKIATRIYASLWQKHDLGLNAVLPEEVLDQAALLSPREVKIRLEAAMAIAASRSLRRLDVAAWQLTAPQAGTAKRRVGFI